VKLTRPDNNGKIILSNEILKEAFQVNYIKYDKNREEHYNIISAFIKSVRGSDPDAALYWLARMLKGGEDPKFIARRMIVLASEDIGNADPYAITLATSAFTSIDYIGMPEATLVLAQAATYLASCPKSNASYIAISKAGKDANDLPAYAVPLHIRNAPTKLMKDLSYGKEYKYSHDFEDHFTEQQYLPDELKNKIYYEPSEIGAEKKIKERLKKWWKERRG
jgi:putative ATPase